MLKINNIEMIKQYVLGFLFTTDCKKVVLIRKNRPSWQEGYANGVGGHIKPSDDYVISAMVREFFEETDVLIENWKPFAKLDSKEWIVYCYVAFSNKAYDAITKTDEEVLLVDVSDIDKIGVLSSLKWLIPMALDNADIHTTIMYN